MKPHSNMVAAPPHSATPTLSWEVASDPISGSPVIPAYLGYAGIVN